MPRLPPPSFRSRTQRGFTLLELAIVIAIVSVVTAIALPIGRHLMVRTRTSAVVNDLRVFSAAFQSYAAEHGDWPPGDGTPGDVPPGMERYLRETNWRQRTPIGGHYAWDPNSVHQGLRHRAAIVIASTTDSPVTNELTQLEQIDAAFDDGNLATGNFLLGYRNFPVFVLEH